MKKHTWAVGFAACLTAFTVFLSLDTFVLSSAYRTDATQMNTEMIQQAKAEAETDTDTETKSETDKKEGTDEKADPDVKTDPEEEADAYSKPDMKIPHDENVTPGSEKSKPGSSAGKKKRPGGTSGFRKAERSSSVGGSSGAFGSVESDDSTGSVESDGIHFSGEDSSDSKIRKDRHGNGNSGKSSSSAVDEEALAREAAEVTTDHAGTTDMYKDENVTIQYTEYTTNGTTIHVADVQLTSIEYLKTAFAENTYGKNVTESTSDIAAAHDAVLAINGDYYGVQEKGYVIRNGIVYRDKAGTSDILCIYVDGSMNIVDPSTVTAKELVEQGVWQAFSFGPGLIENGEISVSLNSEVGKAKASNPRTAIGMIDELHYVFVVSDGRSDESEGLSLYELATFMEQLGVKTAYNLDGGGSSTMVFQNEVVNDPAGGFGDREREVSDIVYIG